MCVTVCARQLISTFGLVSYLVLLSAYPLISHLPSEIQVPFPGQHYEAFSVVIFRQLAKMWEIWFRRFNAPVQSYFARGGMLAQYSYVSPHQGKIRLPDPHDTIKGRQDHGSKRIRFDARR